MSWIRRLDKPHYYILFGSNYYRICQSIVLYLKLITLDTMRAFPIPTRESFP